jgi:uncharacterized oxidoreductase
MDTLADKTVLITGGSSGIGFEMAKRLAALRAEVIVRGRSEEKLREAKRLAPELSIARCDVADADDRRNLLDGIRARRGRIDLLVNNAGIGMRYLLEKGENLEKRVTEEWRTNFLAPLLLTQEFLPLLEKSSGTVAFVGSGLAYIPLSVEPSYCASKAALHSMAQSMRLRYSKRGVKVAEIFYPAVDTPFQRGRAPANAMSPVEAAGLAVKGLLAGKAEIHVGMAGFMRAMSRIMPGKALRIINGFIPDDVEEILAREERG